MLNPNEDVFETFKKNWIHISEIPVSNHIRSRNSASLEYDVVDNTWNTGTRLLYRALLHNYALIRQILTKTATKLPEKP